MGSSGIATHISYLGCRLDEGEQSAARSGLSSPVVVNMRLAGLHRCSGLLGKRDFFPRSGQSNHDSSFVQPLALSVYISNAG